MHVAAEHNVHVVDEFLVRSEGEMDSRGPLTIRREVSVIITRKDATL